MNAELNQLLLVQIYGSPTETHGGWTQIWIPDTRAQMIHLMNEMLCAEAGKRFFFGNTS